MAFVEGDRFRHKSTGQLYQVKVIENDTIVLESEDTPCRMWFYKADFELLFEMAEKRTRK